MLVGMLVASAAVSGATVMNDALRAAISSYTLDAVFTIDKADGSVLKHVNVEGRRRRQLAQNSRRLSVETAEAVREKLGKSRGDLVKTLAALNFLSYSQGFGSTENGDAKSTRNATFSFIPKQIAPIYENGDGQVYITRGKKVRASARACARKELWIRKLTAGRACFPQVSVDVMQDEAFPNWWQSYRSVYTSDGQSLRYIQTPSVPDGESWADSYGAFAMVRSSLVAHTCEPLMWLTSLYCPSL